MLGTGQVATTVPYARYSAGLSSMNCEEESETSKKRLIEQIRLLLGTIPRVLPACMREMSK
jgi:hypothetical protein